MTKISWFIGDWFQYKTPWRCHHHETCCFFLFCLLILDVPIWCPNKVGDLTTWRGLVVVSISIDPAHTLQTNGFRIWMLYCTYSYTITYIYTQYTYIHILICRLRSFQTMICYHTLPYHYWKITYYYHFFGYNYWIIWWCHHINYVISLLDGGSIGITNKAPIPEKTRKVSRRSAPCCDSGVSQWDVLRLQPQISVAFYTEYTEYMIIDV